MSTYSLAPWSNSASGSPQRRSGVPPPPKSQPHSPRQPRHSYQMGHLNDYEMLQRLGKGTFGLVTKARQRSSGKLVALKKFIVHDRKDGFPITSFREITIMKKLRHENVLQLVDMVHERGSDGKALGFFYTVTPYISSDLNGLLNNPRVSLNIPQIKCIIRQSLQGIDYVHSQHYLHRDIKTANILLDFFGVVKLADFGLARVYHGPLPMTPNSPPGGGWYEYTGLVVTRWYRPPELLLGERKYTTAVDMWGMGCVLGEMYKRKPILEGESDLDQADRIFRLVGSPTEETFPHYEQTNRNNVNVKVNYDRTLEKEYRDIMDEGAIELLSGLLTLDPQKRFNAKKALESPFFTSGPLPCQPAELPKFEESHESDIKRFKHEAQSSVNASRSLDHSRYGGAPEMERAASYQSSEQGGAVMESHYIPQQGDYHSGGSWTANRRRGRGYGRVQNEVYKEELPSSKAHGADLYGAEEDKSFSEMKRFLHHEKRQKTTE